MVNERIAYTVASAEMKMQKHTWSLPMGPLGNLHLHPELEFILIKSGSFLFHIEEKTISLREGDVLVINSRVPHFGEVVEEGSTFFIVQFCVPHEEKDIGSRFSRFFAPEAWRALSYPAKSEEARFLGKQIEHPLCTPYQRPETQTCYAMVCKYELLGFLYENEYLSDAGVKTTEKMN